MKLIKIIKGTYGHLQDNMIIPKTSKSTPFEVNDNQAKRLIKNEIAELVNSEEQKDLEKPNDTETNLLKEEENETNIETDVEEQLTDEDEVLIDFKKLTPEVIESMKKSQLNEVVSHFDLELQSTRVAEMKKEIIKTLKELPGGTLDDTVV